MPIKHSFTSAKVDVADTSLVRPSDWNADHTIDDGTIEYAKIQDVSATDKLLGRSTAGAGVIEEIPLTAAGRALLDDANAGAQRTTLGLGTLATQSVVEHDTTLVGNGTVASPLGLASSTATAFHGSGVDGDIVFDGAATITLLAGKLGTTSWAPAANVYTLTRDLYAHDITINNGVTVKTQGFGVFCTGTLTNNGILGEKAGNGGNAAGVSPGAGGTRVHTNTSRRYMGGAQGGQGSVSGVGTGGSGGGAFCPATATSGALAASGVGIAGSNGGILQGGGGGAGAASGGSPVSANTYDVNASWHHFDLNAAISGHLWAGGTSQFTFGSGGGGGSGAGNNGGGGGGCGGCGVGVFAREITGSGTIRADGGDGGNGLGTGGGGGGGSGGYLCVATNTSFSGASVGGVSLTIAGGTKGTAGGGLGSADGGNGGAGLLVTFLTD